MPSPLTMLAVKVSLVASLLVFSIILEHSNGLEVDVNVAIKPPKGKYALNNSAEK